MLAIEALLDGVSIRDASRVDDVEGGGMRSRQVLLATTGALSMVFMWATACSFSSPAGEGSCPIGGEGCACTVNGACDPGLTCLSSVCVTVPDSGTDGGTGSCNAGQATCNAMCTDLSTDNANCGSCGNACPGGTKCAAGSCW